MTTGSTGLRGVRIAAAALLVLTVTATGCGRPSDETWLRVISFADDSGSDISHVTSIVKLTTTTTKTTTTELGATDYVNVVFANQSTVVGTKLQAGGVTVDQVQITYAIAGYSPPGATCAVTLYVPASDSTAKTATTATLKIALVSTGLKSWLAATIPETVLAGGLDASARLVFHARTDEGGELEAAAGIGILFENDTVSVTPF